MIRFQQNDIASTLDKTSNDSGIGGIVGAVAGAVYGKCREGKKVSEGGVKSSSPYTLGGHPLLIDRIKDGWGFSKPSA